MMRLWPCRALRFERTILTGGGPVVPRHLAVFYASMRTLRRALPSVLTRPRPYTAMTHSGHSTGVTLDRPSPLGDHAAVGTRGRRHGPRRLAAAAWPRTL